MWITCGCGKLKNRTPEPVDITDFYNNKKRSKKIMTKISNKYGDEINFDNVKTYDAVGCEHCNHTGYYGRIGVFEILDISDEIKELVVKGASTIEIRNKAIEQGYRPLIIDGIKKILNGDTTLDELNRQLIIF